MTPDILLSNGILTLIFFVDRSNAASSSHLANAAFTAVSPALNVSLNDDDGCVQASS